MAARFPAHSALGTHGSTLRWDRLARPAGHFAACRQGDLRRRLLGDGLIPLDAALGRHPDPAHTLRFAGNRTAIAFGMHHVDLLSRVEVYEQTRGWLAQRPPQESRRRRPLAS